MNSRVWCLVYDFPSLLFQRPLNIVVHVCVCWLWNCRMLGFVGWEWSEFRWGGLGFCSSCKWVMLWLTYYFLSFCSTWDIVPRFGCKWRIHVWVVLCHHSRRGWGRFFLCERRYAGFTVSRLPHRRHLLFIAMSECKLQVQFAVLGKLQILSWVFLWNVWVGYNHISWQTVMCLVESVRLRKRLLYLCWRVERPAPSIANSRRQRVVEGFRGSRHAWMCQIKTSLCPY
jgi:hypothetical protein